MNCESIQTLLNHRDLNAISDSERRAVQSHVASCPECAAAVHVHERCLAMRVPSVPADLEKRCFERIASGTGKRERYRRVGPFVLGSLVIAAAAATVGPSWFGEDEESSGTEVVARSDSISVQSSTDAGAGPVNDVPGSFSPGDDGVAGTSAIPALTSAEPFTVELTRLVPLDQNELSRLFGDWFHAALVDELHRVPNLVLIEAADEVEVPSIPGDDMFTGPFFFDMDTKTWPDDYHIRMAAGAGVGDDWVGKQWSAVSADRQGTGEIFTPGGMRSSVEARPEYAAELAEEVIEILKVELFPADASTLASEFARYEAIVADTSADVGDRTAALAVAAQLARRADNPNISARLVEGTLAFAEQFEDALLNSSDFARIASRTSATEMAAVRAQAADLPADILGFLRGAGDARVIGPMSEALLYDQSEAVRIVATSILGEFVDDPVARSALVYAAEFDASAEVRETASSYLLE